MKPIDEFIAEQRRTMNDKEILEEAERRGFVIHRPLPPSQPLVLDVPRIKGERIRIGVISDIHAGSKFNQPSLLREHVAYMHKRGVRTILVPGDVTDGSSAMHPGFEYEVWAHGFDAQRDAALNMIPELKGTDWYLIDGNHDVSHYKAAGADIVAAICRERDDLHYLTPEVQYGHRGATGYVELGGVLVQLCHPHMGITRQRSYRLELWIERLQPPRPRIVVMGNFHRAVQYYDENRLIWGVMVPAFQGQSTWMASKGIASTVGSCIIEFGASTKGIAPSFTVEWLIEPEPRRNDFPTGR